MDRPPERSLALATAPAPTVPDGEALGAGGTDGARQGRSSDRIRGGPAFCVAVGAALAIVLAARWTGGWLLLLDWAPGPEPVGESLGLPSGPAIAALAWVIGVISPSAVGWGVVVGGVLASYAGGLRLARCWRGPSDRPLSWWVLPIAGLLAATNPFVVARVYSGQISVLWGYAAVWFLAASLLHAERREAHRLDAAPPAATWNQAFRAQLRPSLWCAVAAAFSLHLLVVGLVVASIAAAVGSRRIGPRAASARLAAFCAVSVGVTAAWLVPRLLVVQDSLGSPGGSIGARIFASGGPLETLWARAAGGAGFWRALPAGSLSSVGWMVAAAWLLTLTVAWRYGAGWSRSMRHVLLGCAAFGVVAAHLGRGITAEPWSWLITAVPPVGLFREPGKFAMLALLLPACGAAAAAQRLLDRRGPSDGGTLQRAAPTPGTARPDRLVAAAIGLAVVGILASWSVVAATLRPSTFPDAWRTAGEVMAVDDCPIAVVGDGAYTDPGFTRGRTVAHPARGFFGTRAIVSTDPLLRGLEPRPGATAAARWLDAANGRYLDDGTFAATPSSAAAAGVGWVFVARPVDRPELAESLTSSGFEAAYSDELAAVWRVPGACT